MKLKRFMTNLRKEKQYYPNWISGYTRKSKGGTHLTKIVAVLFIVCFSTVNIFGIGSTFSYFTDSEESLNNTYQAGTLDFSISSPGDFAPGLTPVQIATRSVTLKGSGTLGFLHSVKATDLTGDLCSSVQLTVTVGTQQVYQGLLSSFNKDAGTFSNTEEWLFQAEITAEDASLNGKTCAFKLAFEAWQTNLVNSSEGFYDKEELTSSLSYAYTAPVPLGPDVSLWNENFESYSLGSLPVVGTPKWQIAGGSFPTDGYYTVTDADKFEGVNGGFLDTNGPGGYTSIIFDPNQEISSGKFDFQVNVKQTNWALNSYFFFEFWAKNGDRFNFKFWPESADQWSLSGGFNQVDCSTGGLILLLDNQVIDTSTLFSKNIWSTIKLQFDMDNHIVKIGGNNGTTDTNSKCFWFDGAKSNEILDSLKIFGYASKTYFDNLKAN
jgi:predicted ribosomally synthesized peptide with SipW-like signal peptide